MKKKLKGKQRKVKDKDPNAVALGKKGGKKGGPARAQSLTASERRSIAEKGGLARHHAHEN